MTVAITIGDQELVMASRPCPTCRGAGYTGSGHVIRVCPECLASDAAEFAEGLKDCPPCFGFASCREECMGLCPFSEGCKEVVR